MSSSTVATPGRKKAPGPSNHPRRRARAGKAKARARRSTAIRRLWPVATVAAGVFAIAYLLDPGAVAHLIWACLAGQLGHTVRIASFGVVFVLAGALAWALSRPSPAPPARPSRKARSRAAPSGRKSAQTGSDKAPPPDAAQAGEPDGGAASTDTGERPPRQNGERGGRSSRRPAG